MGMGIIPKDLSFNHSENSAMDAIPTPTARELEILKILWEKGARSVKAVHRQLAPGDDLAYNTVQTLLRIMEEKRLVKHHVEGRTFIYTPCYSRDENTVRFLDHVFDGAASQLVMSLLRSERVSPAELEKMQQMITQARRKKK
jgi:predicted transcriptional regulator